MYNFLSWRKWFLQFKPAVQNLRIPETLAILDGADTFVFKKLCGHYVPIEVYTDNKPLPYAMKLSKHINEKQLHSVHWGINLPFPFKNTTPHFKSANCPSPPF